MKKLILLSLMLLLNIGTLSAEVTTTFYHYDLLGSPVATTDEDGAITWRENYEPWGKKIRNEDANIDNVRDYTGHVHDKETGLTYMQARYYDPEIGRFMGIDPVGFQESNPMMFNRYAYANNNPYNFTDPNGEVPSRLNRDIGFLTGSTGLLGGARGGSRYSSIMTNRRPALSAPKNHKMKPIAAGVSRGVNTVGRKANLTDINGNVFPRSAEQMSAKIGQPKKVGMTPDGTIRTTWTPNSSTKIRHESHPHGVKPGDPGYNPRHHGEHFHVETKPNNMSWNQAKKQGQILKSKPDNYTLGNGTGFLSGEKFPGF